MASCMPSRRRTESRQLDSVPRDGLVHAEPKANGVHDGWTRASRWLRVCESRMARLACAAMPDFIYHRDGDVFAPTRWAGSPWSRELQHGGPVCGLVARAAEEAARETGLRVARLTVDLCRPTPLVPLTLASQYLRRGRRLALIEVRLLRGD